MDNIPIEADMPRYRENFKISNPKRSTITGNIETTVSSDCARMIPVTVRLVDFEVVNKTPRWHFQVENTGSTPWEGILRIYLLSHGRPVDHMDLPISSPMDVGQGVRDYMNSSHAPMVMQGDVDQYGWTYLTTALHTRPESALSRP
ncbi:MAG TPA: hypothetical protein VKU00_22390 [Chthonomonadaceae bacterium]|nr:hypothetical protein [Chthonomonadaceae bacterium]